MKGLNGAGNVPGGGPVGAQFDATALPQGVRVLVPREHVGGDDTQDARWWGSFYSLLHDASRSPHIYKMAQSGADPLPDFLPDFRLRPPSPPFPPLSPRAR